MFAVLDWGTSIATALTNTIADFTDGLEAAIPVVLGLAALTLVFRKVRGLIR